MAQPHDIDNSLAAVGTQVSEAAMRSNQALLLIDSLSMRILDINTACHALLGFPVEMLLSLRLQDLVAHQDRDKVKQAVDTLSDGSAWNQRLLCDALRGDNSTLPISLSIEVDADPQSSRTKLLVSFSEVAETEQLNLSMETALRAANISFSIWTLNSNVLAPWHIPDAEKPIRSYTPVGTFLKRLNPVDRRETLALLDAVSSGLLDSIDTTVSTTEADGSQRWLRLTGIVPPRKPGTLLALQNDVTESHRMQQYKEEREQALRQVEEKLHRSETELHELLAIIPDFIVRLDSRAVVKYASPSFINDCKREDQELIGSCLISVLSVDTRTAFSDALGSLSDGIEKHEFVTEEIRNGKERCIWWTLIKMSENSAEKGVLCLGRDVTERSQARRQLERQAKQLKLSNASLDDFASVVSHDLQAPLRHIVNFSELLEDELGEEGNKNLDVVKSSALRLQDMTSNLLNFSRLGMHYERMKHRSLTELISEAIDMLSEPMKRSGAKVQMSMLPEIYVDPLLMTRLFQNLLSNSIKYCSAGITPEIQVAAERDGDHWNVSWEDKGIGIDPSHSQRIFKIFTRLHTDESVYAGSGVGLALCKRIVESHGGDIYLDTDYQEGARFVMRFPIVDSDETKLYS